MESTQDNKVYELSYHLTSDLEEDKLVPEMQKVEGIISQLGGSVVTSRDPQRKHLSYPINHKRTAFFGYIDFSAPQDTLSSLNDQLKLSDSVIRFLVTVKNESGPGIRAIVDKTQRKSVVKPTTETKVGAKPKTKPATPEQQEKMEEEIEDVLEKI